MSNMTEIYRKYQEERLREITYTEIDPMKVRENYHRGIDYFNSYGLTVKAKTQQPTKANTATMEALTDRSAN